MKLLLITLFLAIVISVNAQDFNAYENLKIKTEISSNLILESEDDEFNVNYVYANLSFIPENNIYQDVVYSASSTPLALQEVASSYAYFRWNNPKETNLELNVYTEQATKVNFLPITTKVKFPIEDNLQEFQQYLIDTETVTSKDPKIIEQANELAQGEDDLYILVHKTAIWTKSNINYSLETLTEEVSQDASWVLENKIGVCDELTSLFVAILRSLNIPARFSTGQSYTNLINGFGNHAWAEVYFPGYGWVAFDPTYGQYGYVDSTHIKMKSSQDVKESDINYGWLSSNVDVKITGLEVTSNILETGSLYKEDVELNVEVLKNDVGRNSYIPIKVNVKNLNNYYVPLTIYINRVPVLVQDYIREILLNPNEEKSVFFIIKSPDDLEEGFIYTSQISIADNFKHEGNATLNFISSGDTYTLKEAQEIVNEFIKEEEKVYSKNVALICNLDKNYYYDYESGIISCEITNKGNTQLNNLEICYNEECQNVDLNIVETKTLEFQFTAKDENFFVTASNIDVNKVFVLNPGLLQTPNLNLEIIGYPSETNFFDRETIKINLNTNSPVENLEIKLNNREIYSLESFNGEESFDITLRAYSLREHSTLTVNYEDKSGKKYSTREEFDVLVRWPFYLNDFWIIAFIIILVIVSRIWQRKQQPKIPRYK